MTIRWKKEKRGAQRGLSQTTGGEWQKPWLMHDDWQAERMLKPQWATERDKKQVQTETQRGQEGNRLKNGCEGGGRVSLFGRGVEATPGADRHGGMVYRGKVEWTCLGFSCHLTAPAHSSVKKQDISRKQSKCCVRKSDQCQCKTIKNESF